MRFLTRFRLAPLLLALLVAACGKSPTSTPPPATNACTRQSADSLAIADFGLTDVNPNSETYAYSMSPRCQVGKISAWYFGHATWGYCRSQFGYLDKLQADLDTLHTPRRIEILGVNGIGHEGGNADACAGRTIPWLQDVDAVNVWASWAPEYRDVVVLDASNHEIAVYNLTLHDLGNPTYYAELRAILLAAAQ